VSDSKPTGKNSVVAVLAAVAVLFCLTFMRQLGETSSAKQENARLAEENKALQEQLAKAGVDGTSTSNPPSTNLTSSPAP
jgi:cell division protein ZapA (FtsZ GTPase activity inhibitor)